MQVEGLIRSSPESRVEVLGVAGTKPLAGCIYERAEWLGTVFSLLDYFFCFFTRDERREKLYPVSQ